MLLKSVCFLVYFSLFYQVLLGNAKPVDDNMDSTHNRTVRQAGIIFPEDEEDSFSLDGPPPCAQDSTFCEHFRGYPQERLSYLLKKHRVEKHLFGTDVVPEIESRRGIDNFVCRSRIKTIFPKVGKNVNNNWRIIINQEDQDEFIQGVVIETCVGKNKPCDIPGGIVNDFVTTCKQKYIYRRLLSLSDNGEPTQDTFILPSACCCTYKRTFDFLGRIGT